MAARKSCTKLTWAEAKAKVGGSNPKGGGGKKDKQPKGGNTHDKMLAAKIITKNLNVSQGEQIANRQAAKMAKKDLERAAYLEQKRQEEKEANLQKQNILAYKLAKQQMRFGGNIIAFTIKGGLKKGEALLNNVKLCSLSANLGDSRSIITHPASTTHGKLSKEDRLAAGITDGLVRLSVGLENPKDVIKDLKQALELI